MLHRYQKIFRGAGISQLTEGVLYLRAPFDGVITRLDIFQARASDSVSHIYNLSKNGANVWSGGDRLSIASGQSHAAKNDLEIEVERGDILLINVAQWSQVQFRDYSPIAVNLEIGDGVSGGGAEELGDLEDVEIIDPEFGEILIFDGEDWVNAPAPESDGWNGGKPSNGLENFYFRDDFIQAGSTSNGANITSLFNHQTSTGNGDFIASELNHPGIFRMTVTNTTSKHLRLSRQITGVSMLNPANYFDCNFIFRLNRNSDASWTDYFRLGLAINASGADLLSLNHGIYVENKGTDGTTFYAVCNTAGTETRSSLGTLANDVWCRMRIRRISSTEIGFTMNDGTEVIITTNIPTTPLDLFCILKSASAAPLKTLDVDYIDLEIRGLSRY